MSKILSAAIIWGLACITTINAGVELKLPALFEDNMVLQREQPVPVWGDATPGSSVSVTFRGQTKTTTAGADGHWQLKLDPMKASLEPAELTVTAKLNAETSTLTSKGVLVGEVWVCSGQSNMDMMLAGVRNSKDEVGSANLPLIRMFNVSKELSAVPKRKCRGQWVTSTPETAGGFSAVGFFFARKLNQDLGVPVGMLNASWGGTPAQGWTPLETQRAMPELKQRVERLEAELAKIDRAAMEKERVKAVAAYQEKLRDWLAVADKADPGSVNRWEASDFDTTAWREGFFPMLFDGDLQLYSGFIWCRKQVKIPQTWVGRDLTLGVCAVDECHIAYVNGTQIGMTWYDAPDFWFVPHQYKIPASAVTGPDITVTLRIFNLFGGVGTHGPARDLFILPAAPTADDKPVSLAGAWKYTPGGHVDAKDVPQPQIPSTIESNAGEPSLLYNGMIAPLIPYAIRGAIWYQGESNAGEPELYRKLFPAMITAWRNAWGQGAFPFYYVQLANFMVPQSQPVEINSWADLRDTQTTTLALENTGMAVITDIGDAQDIHPRNKQDVGLRLALIALANIYGQKVEFAGPTFSAMHCEGNTATISFTHADGLKADDSAAVTGFAMAGEDKVFHRANATLSGQTAVLTCPVVKEPKAVRYNWGNNPVGVLRNASGLPASCFRTDTWASGEIRSATEPVSP